MSTHWRLVTVIVVLLFGIGACVSSETQQSPGTPSATLVPTVTVTHPPVARTDCAERYPSDPIEKKNWPKEEWTESTLEEHCMDRAKVEKGASYLEKTYNYSSVVIIRHGELVYEKYFSRSANPDRRATMYSMTKSVLSALFGIAIDQGRLDSLDHKVIEYFPEYFYPSTDPHMRDVTLRDLLTMSVPFLWVNENDVTVAPWINSGKMVEKAINLNFQNILPPEPEFNYCTPNTQILSAVLTKIVGVPLRSYAQENLFGPLGIPEKEWGWGVDDHGYYLGGYGMAMQPRDLVRFGYLYANHGTWDGRQVVSEEWVRESTTKNLRATSWMDYGYLWWIHISDDPPIFEARGSGGQILSVIPSLDMAILVTGVGGGDMPDPDFVIHEYFVGSVMDE